MSTEPPVPPEPDMAPERIEAHAFAVRAWLELHGVAGVVAQVTLAHALALAVGDAARDPAEARKLAQERCRYVATIAPDLFQRTLRGKAGGGG